MFSFANNAMQHARLSNMVPSNLAMPPLGSIKHHPEIKQAIQLKKGP